MAHILLKKKFTYADKIFSLLFKYMKIIKNIKDAEKFFSSDGTGYHYRVHRSTLGQQSYTMLMC